jgi:hypothetical protein
MLWRLVPAQSVLGVGTSLSETAPFPIVTVHIKAMQWYGTAGTLISFRELTVRV